MKIPNLTFPFANEGLKVWRFYLECWINQSRVACNLVTNFEVALIKKLWQCSVLSRTLQVAVPSPPPTLGEGEGTANISDIWIGLSRIPLDNICV